MREFKRGDIIVDPSIPNDDTRYLILKEKENSFYCLNLKEQVMVNIGKFWIDKYNIVNSIDVDKVIDFMKEE